MKRRLTLILTAILLSLCCFALSACGDTLSIAKTEINELGELVVTYTDGTSTNLGKVKGENGKDGINGKDGADGKTPTVEIDEDGYWVINGEKTDVKAEGGKDENPQGLDFYPKDDGSYAVSVGKARFLSKIEIPETYNGKPVTEIKESGFVGSKVVEITIPNTTTIIGEYAFNCCKSLTSVTIPNSVTSIGEYAFNSCNSLTSVTIGNSVTSIGSYAFLDCTGLTSITIPDSVTSIGNYAFFGCLRLTIACETTVKPSGWDSMWRVFGYSDINGYEYYDCPVVWEIIDYGCSEDGIIWVQNSDETITVIGYCGSSDKITIPDNINGQSVTSIGECAFGGCAGLMSVTIPNSVTSIGKRAFDGCVKLVEVINKSSLDITAGSSSYGYVGYYAKEVHSGESKIINQNGYLFYTYNEVNYLFGYTGEDKNLILPESYNGEGYEIFGFAFCVRDDITSVTIPDSVTYIGELAFYYCTSLTSVTIPGSVTSIGYSAFSYCDSLTSVTIGDSVTTIGDCAFSYCDSLTSVTIPDSVTSIGYSAFRNCTSLTSVTFENPNGWWYAYNYDDTSGTSISAASLANESTAAKYLTDTYAWYYWGRG